MGYVYLIGGKKGYVMVHSTCDYAFGPIFPSKKEGKHFIGFWLTNYDEKDWEDCYGEWYEKYYDEDGETFLGKIDEWDWKNLSYSNDSDDENDDDGDEKGSK